MASPKTILLKGDGIIKEALAGGAIMPGHLVDLNSSGAWIVHAGAGLTTMNAFALEDEFNGKEIDQAYASGDNVRAIFPQRGSEVYAWLAASAAAVVIGSSLQAAADGTVRIQTTDSATDDTQRHSVVGIALEAVDNSGGGSAVRVRILVL
jgi:hypothetical protein